MAVLRENQTKVACSIERYRNAAAGSSAYTHSRGRPDKAISQRLGVPDADHPRKLTTP
jgi:hypothetical protein